jgi:hypothetical protein
MFMTKLKIAPSLSAEYLQVDKPSPLADNKIESLIQEVLSGGLDKDITDAVYTNFLEECEQWIVSSSFNNLRGLDSFSRKDIVIGCTQFIDTLYMKGDVQVLPGDYKYHERLGNEPVEFAKLKSGVPLIIAMPFPSLGDKLPNMEIILDMCYDNDIPVHIDGAWITCCRDIDFDFNHPAIQSVAISLSKGLGLGWNRVGVRWTRKTQADAISIMNDFHMNNRALVMIGLHFIRNLQPDHLWKTHEEHYYKVCKDLDLTPTKSVYLALKDNQPVGISPLIRFLENEHLS